MEIPSQKMTMRAIWLVAVTLLGCSTPSIPEELARAQKPEEVSERAVAECVVGMQATVDPVAANPKTRMCFDHWVGETCKLRGEYALWENVLLRAENARSVLAARESLGRMPGKHERADGEYRICVEYASGERQGAPNP